MSARLRCRLGLLLAASLLAGCQAQQPAPPTAASAVISPVTSPATAAPPQTSSTPAESSPSVADALSQKTAAYARSIETPTGAPEPKPAIPSAVRWERSEPVVGAATPPVAAASNAPAALISAPPLHTPAPTVAKASVADEPVTVPESSDFADAPPTPPRPVQSSDVLETDIERRVHESPQDTSAQLDYQLLQLLKDGSGAELASLTSASPEDREIIAALTDGITNFRTAVRQDNNLLLSAKIKPLLDMSDRLRSLAELTVSTAALCKRVHSFGSYDTMDNHFRAGRENATIVYSEIEDFASRRNANSKWEVKLSQQVSLYTDTEHSILVWKDHVHEVPDLCSERRHDFYMYDLVRLPANLSIGGYILKVTVVDELANHVAEKTLPLEIVADPGDATASTSATVAPN